MEDSIFTKLIKGEIPAHKVYEDERVLAFLDIHPKTDGHTLVIPKKQVEFVWDLSDEDYAAVMAAVRKVADRIKAVLDHKYVGMTVFGMDVPHAHIHVFGFNTPEEHRRIPDQDKEPDHEALALIAKKLAF
jgi:histidine triad (HIT) family protein